MTLFCLSFVTLWNYEVYVNGNAMKQCNFQNNYGAIAQRKVCSCAPIVKFFYESLKFAHYWQIYTKNYHFLAILGMYCNTTF